MDILREQCSRITLAAHAHIDNLCMPLHTQNEGLTSVKRLSLLFSPVALH